MSNPSVAWDKAIYSFLVRIGFSQAASGFEADMLVMNPQWEQNNVPVALRELITSISDTMKTSDKGSAIPLETPTRLLDERKLDYIHLANGVPPRSQSTINKSISLFLAKNRTRNDASNRNEFVYTLAQKRQRLSESGDDPSPSCARADAKPLDRDVQMKYDIAKNENGPLSRTMRVDGEKGDTATDIKGKGKAVERTFTPQLLGNSEDHCMPERHPAIEERLNNIETHLAVRYVPSLPRTLLGRLKFLEEHLIRLEQEYPPWAALHFNQPNRGWPPPPRQTPIIVPPHLRSKDALAPTSNTIEEVEWSSSDNKPRNTGSSLHRAVLERLEVKQAITDLAGTRH